MKFIFLQSGDYLNFTPTDSKFVNEWFYYIFSNNLHKNYSSIQQWTPLAEDTIDKINQCIDICNPVLEKLVPNTPFLFEKGTEFSQPWMNLTHKKWVYITDMFKNKIFDASDDVKLAWDNINSLVHRLENPYIQEFKNDAKSFLPETTEIKITPNDCQYFQQGLVLDYGNLGRHQFNQWEVGAEIDYETNNYDRIPTQFAYHNFNISNYAGDGNHGAPTKYVQWCKDRSLPIIPPWVILGQFTIEDRFLVREIMHRNLRECPDVGFEP